MSISVNVQFEILTAGDGENHTDVFSWPVNNNAPRSPSKQFVNGTSTINVPANAKGVIVKPPTGAGTYTVKGVSGDTGVGVTAGGFLAWRFNPNTPPTTFVVVGSPSGLWSFHWA
jgi:hypothetical protein